MTPRSCTFSRAPSHLPVVPGTIHAQRPSAQHSTQRQPATTMVFSFDGQQLILAPYSFVTALRTCSFMTKHTKSQCN